MERQVHFISGLPRSGSTLLSAILRQNPRFHAGMSGPMGSLIMALLRQMSQDNEFGIFIENPQRESILTGVFNSYYQALPVDTVVFDTNRLWCAKMPLLASLFPRGRVIACVRHMPWIFDSIERLIRRNKFEPSRIFGFDPGGTVYSRHEALGNGGGMIGFAWNALREAFFGDESDRLMLLTYETLTTDPGHAIKAVYDFIGEPHFEHDFDDIHFDARAFDERLGTPGLHDVGAAVRSEQRHTILPPDLFARVEGDSFWLDPERNRRGVTIV